MSPDPCVAFERPTGGEAGGVPGNPAKLGYPVEGRPRIV